MTPDLSPYPEYKDSGLSWLGQVPAHWETRRAKYLYREVDERSETGAEVLCSVSHKTGVTPRKANVTMFMAESTVGYKICRPDDLAINTLWAWMAALGIAKQVGVVSPAYGVYRPRPNSPLLPAFADKLLRIPQYKREYIARSTGVNASRLRLYPDQFLCIRILLPPTSEQEVIVQFLDAMERKVSRFVRNRRRLIDVLNEQKQAIINRAVTRGLNASAHLKPSGIDWLGDIPAHWEVKRLKHIARMESGESITAMSIDEKGEYPVYGGNGLRGYTSRFTHEGEYALIGRQGALCGNINYVSGKFWASEHAIVPTLSGARVAWFGELIRTMNLRQYSISAAQPGLGIEMIAQLRVPVPPIEEQAMIAEWIAGETRALSGAISNAQHEIDLIREYRERLIADVVTGKVDVRGVAPAVRDFAEAEPLLLDEGVDEEMPGEEEGESALEAADAND